jgi:hypothetical protein
VGEEEQVMELVLIGLLKIEQWHVERCLKKTIIPNIIKINVNKFRANNIGK